MDDNVLDDVRRPAPRRGLGRGLDAILPARGIPYVAVGRPGHGTPGHGAPGHGALRLDTPDDGLAGLAGRSELLEELEQAVSDARRDDSTFTLLVFGLDGFRHLNAEFGHEAGDAVIRKLAARLARFRRATDTVARLAGDEFALLCRRADATVAGDRLVARIQQEVERAVRVADAEHRLRATFGLAVCGPAHDAVSGRALLRRADIAMHRAKDAGMAWTLFDAPADATTDAPPALSAVATALAAPAELLRYRPVVDLRRGVVAGARVTRATWEQAPLGELLDEPLSDLAAWAPVAGAWPAFRLWVELPAALVLRPDGVAQVERSIARSGVRPGLVGVVLDGLPSGLSASLDLLQRLAGTGIGLCIGAPDAMYAAETELPAMALTALSLPESLLAGLVGPGSGVGGASNPAGNLAGDGGAPGPRFGSALARAIVGMGRELGLEVLADGVGQDREALALSAVGCTHASGPLYGAPSPADEFAAMLRAALR